jgi:predicted amidohydrolase YtcJ
MRPARVLLILAMLSGCAHIQPADLVLRNGKIVTVDDKKPEARALAVSGDTIVAVGTDREIEPYVAESTRVIDLDGKLAIPGFIDGHGHFMSLGLSRMRLDLSTARNWNEIVETVRVAARKAKPGEWILGRGWHQEKWDRPPEPSVDGLPVHNALSAAAPNNPVLLEHASGHSVIANIKAMQLAGISKKTPDPEGGKIVKGDKGRPIGVFRETAEDLLYDVLEKSQKSRTPRQIESERRQAVELATRECLEKGVTSFQDAGSTLEVIDFYKQLAAEDRLGVRLWVMIAEDNDKLETSLAEYKIVGPRLTVRAVKTYIDGALGAHGAWLLEPYKDMPESSGMLVTPVELITRTAQLAIQNGFQLCTHAIGDKGNRVILDIYEKAFADHPKKTGLRWRVEHAQHLHPDDIERFSKLGVIASMQGVHCTSDGPWVVKRLGEKRSREGAYVWRRLIDSGAIVSNGTDTPVEDVDPIAGFHALVTRRMKNGETFYPEQRITREEALRAYTKNAAYAAFEENRKGSLAPGKLADIVILSRDILTVPEDEILKTKVVTTIVGGKVVYEKL